MLGFEHPSHMVTHPSTDEAQCCLSLEILVNSSKKKKERKKEESRIKSPLRIEGTNNYFETNRKEHFKIYIHSAMLK